MRHLTMLAAAAALSIAAVPAPAAAPQPQTIAAAVAAHDRAADNVKLDAGRKPAQLLQFLVLKRGMRVCQFQRTQMTSCFLSASDAAVICLSLVASDAE